MATTMEVDECVEEEEDERDRRVCQRNNSIQHPVKCWMHAQRDETKGKQKEVLTWRESKVRSPHRPRPALDQHSTSWYLHRIESCGSWTLKRKVEEPRWSSRRKCSRPNQKEVSRAQTGLAFSFEYLTRPASA